MPRRVVWAMSSITAAVMALLFTIGGILDWPPEAFVGAVIGAGVVGMVLAELLFYEEPSAVSEQPSTAEIKHVVEQLADRVRALEGAIRESSETHEGRSGPPIPPTRTVNPQQ